MDIKEWFSYQSLHQAFDD